MPPKLPAGQYAVRAEATSSTCQVIAESVCTLIRLPREGPIVVHLSDVTERESCVGTDRCDGQGRCISPIPDGGIREVSVADGTVLDAPRDTNTPIGDGAIDSTIVIDGGSDAGVAPCTSGPTYCDGTNLVRCVNGVLQQVSFCPAGCSSAPLQCFRFQPSHYAPQISGPSGVSVSATGGGLLIQPYASTECSTQSALYSCSANMQNCLFATCLPRTTVGSDGSAVDWILLRDLTIGVGATLTFRTDRPVVVWADNIRIDGTVVAPRACVGSTAGTSGVYMQDSSEPGGGVGGGGGGHCSAGGAGGGVSNAALSFPGASGGAGNPVLQPSAVPLCGGSRGGDGASPGWDGAPRAVGGSGGGVLQLSASTLMEIRGTVEANGTGGGAGMGWKSGGAGGGSGGTLLIESPQMVFGSGARVTANGGGGGEAAPGSRQPYPTPPNNSVPGTDGASAANLVPALGGRTLPNGQPFGGRGGNGSNAAGAAQSGETAGNGGGGGGGAGIVELRSFNTLPDSIAAHISPWSAACALRNRIDRVL